MTVKDDAIRATLLHQSLRIAKTGFRDPRKDPLLPELLAASDVERLKALLCELGKSLELDVEHLTMKELAKAVSAACPSTPNPHDVPPRERLGKTPVVESEHDVDRALEELAWAQSFEQTAQAGCDGVCRSAKSILAAKLQVEIEGEAFNLADRRAALVAAIKKYSDTHRKSLLPKGKKTRGFTYGEVGWTRQATGIEFGKGLKKADVLVKIEKHLGLEARVADLLMESTRFGPDPEEGSTQSRKLDRATFLRVSYEPNNAAIKAAFLGKRLTPLELRMIGYRPNGGKDVFHVDVAEYVLQSERKSA